MEISNFWFLSILFHWRLEMFLDAWFRQRLVFKFLDFCYGYWFYCFSIILFCRKETINLSLLWSYSLLHVMKPKIWKPCWYYMKFKILNTKVLRNNAINFIRFMCIFDTWLHHFKRKRWNGFIERSSAISILSIVFWRIWEVTV